MNAYFWHWARGEQNGTEIGYAERVVIRIARWFFVILFFATSYPCWAEGCGDGDLLVAARFGDLTSSEIMQIQSIVDQLGRDLFVVGSAAQGKRRNKGTDFPLGKGKNQRSDIDYVVPIQNERERQRALQFIEENAAILRQLPDIDQRVGVLSPDMNRTRIWFRPHLPPWKLYEGAPAPKVMHWPADPSEIQGMEDRMAELNASLRLIDAELEDPGLSGERSTSRATRRRLFVKSELILELGRLETELRWVKNR